VFRLISEWLERRQASADRAEEIRVWLRRVAREWR
jgi:hypothetical protein